MNNCCTSFMPVVKPLHQQVECFAHNASGPQKHNCPWPSARIQRRARFGFHRPFLVHLLTVLLPCDMGTCQQCTHSLSLSIDVLTLLRVRVLPRRSLIQAPIRKRTHTVTQLRLRHPARPMT
jgi:hypothetical protein